MSLEVSLVAGSSLVGTQFKAEIPGLPGGGPRRLLYFMSCLLSGEVAFTV